MRDKYHLHRAAFRPVRHACRGRAGRVQCRCEWWV